MEPSVDEAGSTQGALYERFVAMFPDPRMRFMNHGYADLGVAGDDDACAGLSAPEEIAQPYCVGLVRAAIDGVLLSGRRVLDVGCGRGGAVAYIARRHAPAYLWAIDYAQANISFCRLHGPASVDFMQGDAHNLPLPAGAADVVVNIESSHCYPSPQRFFAEVERVLAPGGRFCYADVVDDAALARTERLLAASGMRQTARRDLTAGVARALVLDRARRARLMRGMIDAALDNRAVVEGYLDFCDRLADAYRERRLSYVGWQLEKTE